ncbi:AAA family ATPase (plasmid) [Pedobacter sp. BS3]|uniref:BT4734/BF3469 family protein n=1 Tax=Pedobacter sp. BS3 TaxID=2567937 RepID=UPI0011EE0E23|nr:BT4734/BF3469 family protein [Pedobacter sp. BS3]TZF85808.1 AAA family ATPase [Pedobacter sp. BS3]
MVKIQNPIVNITVSMFRNCISNGPRQAKLETLLEAIKNGRYAAKINEIRMANDKAIKNKLKTNGLPAFTPSGVFNGGRTIKNLVNYNPLVVLDFDNIPLERYQEIFYKITASPYTLSAFKSPKGNGIKVLILTSNNDAENHSMVFYQVVDYYQELVKFDVDQSGKDVSRLCIVSYDEHTYISDNPEVFKVRPIEEQKGELEVDNLNVDFNSGYAMALSWTKKREQFEEGSRNNFIYYLACCCNRIGLKQDKVREKIIMEYGKSEDLINEFTKSVDSAYEHHREEFGKFRHIEETDIIEEAVAEVAQQPNATVNGKVLRGSLKTFRELADEGKNLKPLKKIFGNYILEKNTVLFPSERGVGKSLLAMQLALVVANGDTEFLGEPIELHGNVLYVNLELGESVLARRMATLTKNIESKSTTFNALALTSREGLKAIIDDIKKECEAYSPVLIIIDNLRTAFSGADNEKNKEMTSAISMINKLKDEVGAAFLIVHHTKKGTHNQLTNSDMQSGAGALTDLVDADFFLRRSNKGRNLRILKRIKSRECEEQDGAKLITLNPETLWFEHLEDNVDERSHVLYAPSKEDSEEINKRILEMHKQGISNAEISRQIGIDRSNVGRRLKQLS